MSETSVKFELSKAYLELVVQAVEQEDHAFIRETMEGVDPADISQLLEEAAPEEGEAGSNVGTREGK